MSISGLNLHVYAGALTHAHTHMPNHTNVHIHTRTTKQLSELFSWYTMDYSGMLTISLPPKIFV